MITYRICCSIFFAFIFSCTLLGCSTYYTSAYEVTPTSAYPSAIVRAKKHKKAMILHSGINVYSITSVQLDKKKQNLTVQLNKANSSDLGGKVAANGTNRTKNSKTAKVSEIHLFTSDSTSYTLDEPHTIAMEKLARVELLGKN